MSTITKKKTKSKSQQILSNPYVLILKNDDYNTFDHVINCLMSICGHELQQANQCAHIVHFKGVCDVKYGDFDTISVMKEKLQNAGLSVTIEENN
jgi:ATP-dependent Clp protease adaptor protein ClpS